MRLAALACLASAVLAAPVAFAAPDTLKYFKTYPELARNGQHVQLNAVAAQDDGKVVVAGTSHATSAFADPDWVVARIDAQTGALDGGFGGGDGVVHLPIDLVTDGLDRAFAVAIGPGGRIYVAGDAQAPGGGWDFAVVALMPTGEPETAFGPGGLRTVGFGASTIDRASAILVDGGGTVTLGGLAGSPSGFGLARFDPSGNPVNGFDTDGKVVTPLGASGGDEVADLVPLDGGDVLAVGTVDLNSTQADIGLAVFDSAGAVGPTKVIAETGFDSAVDALLQPAAGRVLVASNRNLNFVNRSYTYAYELTGLEAIPGYGGAAFGDPSLYGGLASLPGMAEPFAFGIGPAGGGIADDWKTAFVDTMGLLIPPIANFPGSAETTELPGGVAATPFGPFLTGTEMGQPDEGAGGLVVERGGSTTTPPPSTTQTPLTPVNPIPVTPPFVPPAITSRPNATPLCGPPPAERKRKRRKRKRGPRGPRAHAAVAKPNGKALQGKCELPPSKGCPAGKGLDLSGNDLDNTLAGTARSDTLRGNGGGDTLTGGDDNDLLLPGAGRDKRVMGQQCDDVLFNGGNDVDELWDGGAGDDVLNGKAVTMDGGTGDDFLYNGMRRGTTDGGAGEDVVSVTSGDEGTVRGGSGNDYVDAVNQSKDTIDCGAGRDEARIDGKPRDSVRNCEKVVPVG